VDESLVEYSDLTQLDGEPTGRAIPHFERTPAGRNGGKASPAFVVADLAAMAVAIPAAVCAAGIGVWIGAPTSLIMICSVSVLAFVLAVGATLVRRP
jgi:hypothetical protein